MTRKTFEMRLAEIKVQRKTLKARMRKQERANDTRRKVLLGGLILHHLKARPDEKITRRLENFLRRMLPRFLTRDVDKVSSPSTPRLAAKEIGPDAAAAESPSRRRRETSMSEIDPTGSSREEERLLKRTLGCAIPEFIANIGTDETVNASKRNCGAKARPLPKTLCLLERVLVQIDPDRDREHVRNDRMRGALWVPASGASRQGPARPGDDRLSPAPTAGAAHPVITGHLP